MPQPNPHTSPMLCHCFRVVRAPEADSIAIALRDAGCSPVIVQDDTMLSATCAAGEIVGTLVGDEWRLRGCGLDATVRTADQLAALPDLARSAFHHLGAAGRALAGAL